MSSYSAQVKATRRGFLLKMAFKINKIECCFCRKRISPEEAVSLVLDSILIHHKDLNHSNDEDSNLAFAHRKCHASYHRRIERELFYKGE